MTVCGRPPASTPDASYPNPLFLLLWNRGLSMVHLPDCGWCIYGVPPYDPAKQAGQVDSPRALTTGRLGVGEPPMSRCPQPGAMDRGRSDPWPLGEWSGRPLGWRGLPWMSGARAPASQGSLKVIVQTSEDWLVRTGSEVRVLALPTDPTLAPLLSTQLMEVAWVASPPPGSAASDWKATETRDSGVLPKSRSPAWPPEVTVTEWPKAPGVMAPPWV